jgi:predicted glutamine amidotransferase
MGQFWGLTLSDDARVECVLRRYRSHIERCTKDMGSFGVGYYSRGDLLQRVEPRNENESFDLEKVIRGVRSDLILMHARTPRKERILREDIHPFRFKDWLFAHNGKVTGFDDVRERLLEAMPSFIRRNLRGKSDSEYLFHLFLSFLYDAGQINRPNLPVDSIGDAMSRTFSTVDELLSVAGYDRSPASVVVSNGYSVVAGSRGIQVAYAAIDGIENCEVCRISVRPGDKTAVSANHPDLKAVLIYSCGMDVISEPFNRLSDDSLLMVSKNQDISVRALR